MLQDESDCENTSSKCCEIPWKRLARMSVGLPWVGIGVDKALL